MIPQKPLSNSIRSIIFNSVLCCAAFISANTHAIELEEVIVTATLTEKSEHDILASVSVINRADITKLQFNDISNALAFIAGTDVVRSGGLGAPVSLFTRGSNSDHTLMLINGQRFSSATLGTASFQLIDPELIERVEYVRGSRSSLYGSDAISGILQIFTYGYEGDPTHYAKLEAGSHDTYRTAFGSRGKFDRLDYSAGISYTSTDGTDYLIADNGLNGDKDAFSSVSGSLFSRYTFDSGIAMSVSHLQNETENDYDNLFSETSRPFSENTISATQLSLEIPVNDAFTSKLNAGQAKDKSENFDREDPERMNPFANGNFNTLRNSIFWQNDWQIGEPLLATFGVDYYEEEVYGSTEYDEDERDNTAPFAQLQGDLNLFDVQLSARRDDNSSYGQHTTRSAAAGYDIDSRFRLFMSWSEGFKAPSFNELYFPNFGNPDILPEESKNSEFGFKAKQSFATWEVIAFQNDIKNLIETTSDSAGNFSPRNVANAEIKGVEISARGQVYSFVAEGSASYISPKDKDTGQTLNLRSKRKLSLRLGQEFEDINYGLIVLYQGEREDRGDENDNIDSFIKSDLYANITVADSITFGFKIDNLFNEDYVLNPSYNTDGRNYKASVKYNF